MPAAACINYPFISPTKEWIHTQWKSGPLKNWTDLNFSTYNIECIWNFYGESLRQDNDHVRPDCSEFLHITTKSQLWSQHWSLETRGAILTSHGDELKSNYTPWQPRGHGTSAGMRNGETLVRRAPASVVIKSRMWWMEWHSSPGIVTHSCAEN